METNVTMDEVVENERKARIEFEAKKVVTEQGETIAELRKVFDAVCNENDWKDSFVAAVPHQLVGIVGRAVEFFHADKIELVGIEQTTGKVLVRGNGYQG